MTTATTQELEISVLKSKITELKSALFFTESASPVKLPTHVISEVEVDNEGRIWFVVPRPAQHIDAFEKEVAAKLDFFKKGMDFFVKIRGIASLLTDAEMINACSGVSAELKEKMSNEKSMGIMVKIQDAGWVDNTPKASQNWLQSSRSHLSSWFF